MAYNILLEGPVGTGKTTSLRTIVEDCGKKLFVVATEPGIDKILGKEAIGGGLSEEMCHWQYISPAHIGWDVLERNAKLINTMGMADLQKMPSTDKAKFGQFLSLLGAFANFKCDRTGEEFGPVDQFPEDVVLACDGLSGISQMAMDCTVGSKPIKTQPEWGVAMDMILRLVRKLCADTECTFVLNAHIERQLDETGGGTHITLSTLGNKLAPELVKPFDEIILSRKVKDEFFWSTVETNVDLKTRVLGWGDSFTPTFKHFFPESEAGG